MSATATGEGGTGSLRRASVGSLPNSERGRRTRRQLLVAAREVFERDGFLDARVTDISAAAGASHGSFYTYFESKTDIFRTLCAQEMDALYVGTGGSDPDGDEPDPVARIERSNRRFVDIYKRNAALLGLFEQVTAYDEEVRKLRMTVRDRAVSRVQRSIVQLQEAGLADRDLDPFHSASALVTMVNSTVHFWLVLGEQFDEETLVRTLTQLWARALGLDPARAGRPTAP
ncbi:TetR/AcrR family transcriptional regulator [Pseudonocardia kunmingensis]|uniref:TetR family transcriptional regulator n=1 Tax=Pseudonocardia kunmingensis TaxID=630975 RepID=A0A543CYH9_9PSEU|nr:TetR/AcrR family transcriptional regulator [Pseudonocardia kunmingensis]TQM02131.1 TetR family transcriptional regulator [Pseudonocardia kunmingensis]